MLSNLVELIRDIHPDRTGKRYERQADEAVLAFPLESTTIQDAIRFRAVMCDLVLTIDRGLELAPNGVAMPEDLLWRRAITLLRKAYGKHGEHAGLEIAGSCNTEGGMYSILKQIGRHAAKDATTRDVALRVDAFCRRLTADEYLAASTEYIQRYGYLVPAEMKDGFAGRIRANFGELLKRHHHAQCAFDRIGKIQR